MSNDDFVELFLIIGKVEQVEIQYEFSGCLCGSGVVCFDNVDIVEIVINKF